MAMTRREFLRRAGIIGATLPVATAMIGCVDNPEIEDEPLPEYTYDGELGPENIFEHGVASGDPTPASVILWTRITVPEPTAEVEVYWEIARDPNFEELLDAGFAFTHPDRDYTVKIDAFGLLPATTYYYRFTYLGRRSPVGRTRTAPNGPYDHARFAVVSCSNYEAGFFHVYADIARQADLDFVMHLGDYIYEYGVRGDGPDRGELQGRVHEPDYEIITLADYRQRYANYRRDPDLAEVHRQHPFIVVWDDHESANNAYKDGAQNHDPSEGLWPEREADSYQAYVEWMPIRETEQEGRIWRKLTYGDLMDVIMLDTRIWGRDMTVPNFEVALDPSRTILGFDQEEWFADQLITSRAAWRIVGQQVMMAHLKTNGKPNSEDFGGSWLNSDQWDGYGASRFRFFDVLRDNQIDNTIVLTGDIHTSWASDLTPDPNNPDAYDPESGEGSLAVEFVCTSVTSGGLDALPEFLRDRIFGENPHIKYIDLVRRGYVVVDVKPDRAQGAWFHADTVATREHEITFSVAFGVDSGSNRLVLEDEPAAAKAEAPALAPQADSPQ
jgi:alkaline phosphatase D